MSPRRIRIRFGSRVVPWRIRAGVALTLLAAAAMLALLPFTAQPFLRWQEPAWVILAAAWSRTALSLARSGEDWHTAYIHAQAVREAFAEQLSAIGRASCRERVSKQV